MSRFAREHRTFFFEEPIYEGRDVRVEKRQVGSNLFNVVPYLPADVPAENVTRHLRQLLDKLMHDHRIRSFVLWFYTPMALSFARHLRPLVSIYDCMDELSAFRGASPSLGILEQELFARADVVFTGGQSLYEAKRACHPNVHAFPSSVDAEHFTRARLDLQDPSDQVSLARPRFGFSGVIDERMDLELLAKIADERPAWSLVLLGPVAKIDPASLPRRPNIHYLGKKSYQELPAYLAGWDAALMPFALNESTRFISPTKTLEYLAAGKPIVSTPIRDVVRPYGERGLVHVADGDRFVAAIERALASDLRAHWAAADTVLAQTSWDKTWEQMNKIVARAQVGKQSVALPSQGGLSCSTILSSGRASLAASWPSASRPS